MNAIGMLEAANAGRAVARPQAPSGDEAAMRKTAKEFEAQVLGQMFQLVMKDMPIDEVFGGGPGERMFRDMLTTAWAEETTRNGSFGIADSVYRTMLQMQGEQG